MFWTTGLVARHDSLNKVKSVVDQSEVDDIGPNTFLR